jgi:dienelactone hydrolase
MASIPRTSRFTTVAENKTHLSGASRKIIAVALYLTAMVVPCFARTLQYRTYVVPRPNETIQNNCEYQLTIPDASHPVSAVLVVFERGWQFGNLYFDPAVAALAAKHQMAIMLAHHCRSKEREDMDVVPEHGIGRALFTALDQLANSAQHPELAWSKLILFGFSGAGSLVARLIAYMPERVLAGIEYSPSQYDPLGMDTVGLPENALVVPQLIIANGADEVAGTKRPYDYFQRHRKRNAPLTFVVQNRVPHCCVANMTPLVLLWLGEVIRQRRPTAAQKPLSSIVERHAWEGFIKTQISAVKDQWKESVWNVSQAWIEPQGKQSPVANAQDAGWLPSKRFAEAWLAFERQPEHPITPLE